MWIGQAYIVYIVERFNWLADGSETNRAKLLHVLSQCWAYVAYIRRIFRHKSSYYMSRRRVTVISSNRELEKHAEMNNRVINMSCLWKLSFLFLHQIEGWRLFLEEACGKPFSKCTSHISYAVNFKATCAVPPSPAGVNLHNSPDYFVFFRSLLFRANETHFCPAAFRWQREGEGGRGGDGHIWWVCNCLCVCVCVSTF